MTIRPQRIGLVVPAHDEELLIGDCLAAIDDAIDALDGAVHTVDVVVVCDACGDRTAAIVEACGHRALVSHARNVGIARALGADAVLAGGAQWLAFTDADTRVAPGWLKAQLALASDVVCGTIAIDDWSHYGVEYADRLRVQFEQTYRDVDGHRHIHGANLGMTAAAYRQVGGFTALANSEDVAIVRALEACGARIAWSALPRVTTSARQDFRATAGFGAALSAVASTMMSLAQPIVAHVVREPATAQVSSAALVPSRLRLRM